VSSFGEHYHQAEALLEEASDPSDHGVSALHAHIGLAQAHAMLAVALQLDEIRDAIARLNGDPL
jgi:hypothetical protein